MIKNIDFHIKELENMKKYPNELFYIGNINLLQKQKVSIVGTRRPISYTKNFTFSLTQKLSAAGICIVSGAAMGVDAIAHSAATNTIAVVANGLDIRYPAVNKKLITNIEKDGLVLSSYAEGVTSKPYHFVYRNEIVVALGDILIVTQADRKSGSLRSVEFALKQGKEIYVLPHRLGESDGTNDLLKEGLAKPIYDIDEFVSNFGDVKTTHEKDEFLEFVKNYPTYDKAVAKFGEKVFEYELLGKIKVTNGIIFINP